MIYLIYTVYNFVCVYTAHKNINILNNYLLLSNLCNIFFMLTKRYSPSVCVCSFFRQSWGRLCLRHLLSRNGLHLGQGVQSGWTRKLLLRPWKKRLISWCQGIFRLGWLQRSCWPCYQVHSGLHWRQGEEGERCTSAHELAQQPCREEGNKAVFLQTAVETHIEKWNLDKS